MNWNADKLHDVVMPLNEANRIATAQAFTEPTKERSREILALCVRARADLDSYIKEVERET